MKNAIVYADGRFKIADGKTAHGLVRFTTRFTIVGLVDSSLQKGQDAGEVLDGKKRNIPVFTDLDDAIATTKADTFIVGAVSEGGVLPPGYEKACEKALSKGLNVVSGLHEFVSDKPKLKRLAKKNNIEIVDVRKMFYEHKVFYTGRIKDVGSTRIATIGTDSAIGKRTTAVHIVQELRSRGKTAHMIFTGQTGWMQGWPYGIVLDSLINDFVSGGIEDAILKAWDAEKPEYLIIEGQGSLVHPFFPGGFEILAAGQAHGFTLQDAPGRPSLDGFPDYPMPDPKRVVKIAEMLSEKPLVGVTLNHENLTREQLDQHARRYESMFNVPAEDPVWTGVKRIVDRIIALRETGK